MYRRATLGACLLGSVLLSIPLTSCGPVSGETHHAAASAPQEAPTRLAVLWTSADPEVAVKVAFMYTRAAKTNGWFDDVTLIVWGPSSKLLSENAELQAAVRSMAEAGVEVVACKACADSYGVSDALSALGIEVKYMGAPLTEMLKASDWEVITF